MRYTEEAGDIQNCFFGGAVDVGCRRHSSGEMWMSVGRRDSVFVRTRTSGHPEEFVLRHGYFEEDGDWLLSAMAWLLSFPCVRVECAGEWVILRNSREGLSVM